MEDLKNIRHFDEFKEDAINEKAFIDGLMLLDADQSLNEEALWAAIKGLFSKIFGNIDQKLAAKVDEFAKKLDASKDWNESVRLFEQSSKDRQMLAGEEMNAANGPLAVRKVLYDNASMVYVTLQRMVAKYQSPALSPMKIFEQSKDKQMFSFDKADQFTKNLVVACNAKVLELNKAAGNPYEEVALKTYLESNKEISKVEKSPAPAAGGATTGDATTGGAGGSTGL